MNYRFKIDDWLPRFPLQEQYGHYHGEIVTSPWDICQNENLRRETREEYIWGDAVPMDIFIMADGEPADRHVTKIGGLPFRPADAEWPIGRTGVPLVFLAQFNFCDSKDITGTLPGDVLLVFANEAYMPGYIHFEWQRLGLTGLIDIDAIPLSPVHDDPVANKMGRELLDKLSALGINFPDGIPPKTNEISPCYGHIYRTVNYPNWVRRDETVRHPRCRGKEVWSDYHLPTYQATQIGESPFFIQEGDSDAIQGRMLCTISSVQPACDVAYPWINRPEPIPLMGRPADKHLMIGDMGCIYICIDDKMNLNWHQSCY
jgi:Domain of unknown function (DUF1963)